MIYLKLFLSLISSGVSEAVQKSYLLSQKNVHLVNEVSFLLKILELYGNFDLEKNIPLVFYITSNKKILKKSIECI
jgi:hypothetical protein